jgi:hypothetical protein
LRIPPASRGKDRQSLTIATASPASVPALAPVCSPLSATFDFIADVDAFMDDVLNVFGEMGTMYASFSLLLFSFSIFGC